MVVDDDPFDDPADRFGEVERDRHDRPLIKQPDGTVVPYTRTSTMGGKVSSGVGLSIWKTRHVALAVAANEDIAAVIAGLNYGDKQLDGFIENALERAKMSQPANFGTAIHLFTEPDRSKKVPPRRLQGDVKGYREELRRVGFEVVDTEVFVVDDHLQVAGTFDHLYRITKSVKVGSIELRAGETIVGDKKTGKLHPTNVAAQLAAYANSKRYDPKTGNRTLIDPNLNPHIGASVHIPLGSGGCDIGIVDLEAGYVLAQDVMEINRIECRKDLVVPWPSVLEVEEGPADISLAWAIKIDAAKSRSDLSKIWQEAVAAGQWTDDLEELGKLKLGTLNS